LKGKAIGFRHEGGSFDAKKIAESLLITFVYKAIQAIYRRKNHGTVGAEQSSWKVQSII